MKKIVFTAMLMCFGITFLNAQQKEERSQKPPTFSELLKKMDKDDDGKLSASEVKGPLKDDFTKIDADEDGFITEKELEKAPKTKRKEGDR
jgi:Ca2+-binding EF-hand superfamily protein